MTQWQAALVTCFPILSLAQTSTPESPQPLPETLTFRLYPDNLPGIRGCVWLDVSDVPLKCELLSSRHDGSVAIGAYRGVQHVAYFDWIAFCQFLLGMVRDEFMGLEVNLPILGSRAKSSIQASCRTASRTPRPIPCSSCSAALSRTTHVSTTGAASWSP